MKTKKYIALGMCALAFSLSSCEEYLDVNDNPNEAPDAPIENVVTAAMVSVMAGHSGEDARLAGMWTQQFTGVDRQYAAFDVYNVTAGDFNWGKFYYGVIEQSKIIQEKAAVSGNQYYIGVSKIMQAHSFGMMASLYGDIPFNDANQFPAIENPTFDGQVSVYDNVQTLLDEAIASLQNASGSVVEVELFFPEPDGTIDPSVSAPKWIQVANTLKARFYMHTKQYGQALTAAGSGLMSSANDWKTTHGDAYNQDLNLYNSFGVEDRIGYMTAAGAYLPSILDPNGADYRGNIKTDDSDRFYNIYDSTGTDLNYGGMWSPTSSFPIATAIENHLIMAEVNARNSNDADAIDNLNDARAELNTIYGANNYLDYIVTDFIPGGVADKGQGDANANLLYEIIEEKYISLVGQIEAFNDLRRTDNLIGLTPKGSNTMLPQRYIYPTDELNSNTNAPAAIGVFVPTAVNM